MKYQRLSWRSNLRVAKMTWGQLARSTQASLKEMTEAYSLSVALGDLQLIDGRWYVTHAGLLRLSTRRNCHGIRSNRLKELCNADERRWVFRAIVFPSAGSKGFVGYGDAEPSNVTSAVAGAELRIAETRAVNRALRKAYGVGICSVEELGAPQRLKTVADLPRPHGAPKSNSGQPCLRDRLRILIRDYSLNATLVKSYAVDFCGTANLAAASRDSIELFITHLSSAAKENRDALICKLNSYAQPAVANS